MITTQICFLCLGEEPEETDGPDGPDGLEATDGPDETDAPELSEEPREMDEIPVPWKKEQQRQVYDTLSKINFEIWPVLITAL